MLIFRLSAIFLVVAAFFMYGIAVGKYQVFPFKYVREMTQTTKSIKSVIELYLGARSGHEISVPFTEGGVTINHLQDPEDQLTFLTMYRDGAYGAYLIDGLGNYVHKWRVPYEEADLLLAKDTGVSLDKRHKFIHGAHLYPNGDILVSVEFSGLAKLDSQSNLLWVVSLPTHHSVDVDADGSIWVLSRSEIEDSSAGSPKIPVPHWNDEIVHISPDGKVLETFPILEIIRNNSYEGILYGGPPGSPRVDHNDPLHTNDIDILTPEEAKNFDGVKAGDIMVSLRTIDTVIVVDRETKKIEWSMTGPFLRQHDPDVGPDGLLYVFDNRTASGQTGGGHAAYLTKPQAFGYSRVLKIDPNTRQVVWQFRGTEERPFYSSIMGRVEPLANGDVLIVETEAGRVMQVHPESGDIVWEFINLVEPGWVGRVSDADRFTRDQLSFVESN